MQKLPKTSRAIKNVKDLMEVSSMFEANTKKWEATILERGIERGIEQGIERGIGRGIEQGIEKRDLEIVDKMIRNDMCPTLKFVRSPGCRPARSVSYGKEQRSAESDGKQEETP
jgi:hypothetical protein